MKKEGWLTIDRKILNWEFYKDTVVKSVFLHFLIHAVYEDAEKHWNGYKLKRGQLFIGRKQLSTDLGFTENQIRRAIKHLKSTNSITVKTTNRFSVVTICKYSTYQRKEKQEAPAEPPAIVPAKHHIETIKQYNNNISLQESLVDFLIMRIEKKSPMTDISLKRLLTRLDKLGNSEDEKIEILSNSLIKPWTNIYPLKKEYKNGSMGKKSDQYGGERKEESRKARLARGAAGNNG